MGSVVDDGFERLMRRVALSAIVAALAYLAFSVGAGWHGVADAIGRLGVAGLLGALSLSALNYALRFLRWQMYLRRLGAGVDAAPSALIYLAGFAFTATPGKAGELLRGLFLSRRGMSYVASTAAFVSERLSDLVAIVILALPGLSLLPPRAGIGLALAAVAGCVVLALLARSPLLAHLAAWSGTRSRRLQTLIDRGATLAREARRCHTPGVLCAATVLALLAWGAEALAFALVLQLLGVAVALPIAVFIYAAAMLAGAVSFLPGGLGGAEATMIGLLALVGAPHAESVAATIVIRLTTLWFAVALGIGLAVLGRRTLLMPAGRPA